MGAFAHMASELNPALRRVRQMERTRTPRSPGAPPIGPGGTVPPNAYEAEELESTGTDTSRPTRRERPKMDPTFASEIEVLLQIAGDMRQMKRVSHATRQPLSGAFVRWNVPGPRGHPMPL